VTEEAKKVFNPEFLNRIDEIIVFHRLAREELVEIVELQVDEVIARLKELDIDLVLTDAAKAFIIEHGSNEEYGARPLRRAVQQYVEDPLSELMLRGSFEPGSTVVVRPSESGDIQLAFEPGGLPVAEKLTT
jgi:ATP-dependent Clp protease ATP-binding subunit ClpC